MHRCGLLRQMSHVANNLTCGLCDCMLSTPVSCTAVTYLGGSEDLSSLRWQNLEIRQTWSFGGSIHNGIQAFGFRYREF